MRRVWRFTEKDQYWINVSDDLKFLQDGNRFLWSSERSGFRHIYLYDLEGKQLAQLTKGDWEVSAIDAVDEKAGLIYFTAMEKSPPSAKFIASVSTAPDLRALRKKRELMP